MLLQKRYKPHILLAHEALLRRLKKRYRTNDILQSNYWRYKVGYEGELKVDYQLSLFPNENFHHVPSLRLKIDSHYFQIDSLIITPKVIFILEIKNIKGTLKYSSHYGQLIQMNADKETGYHNPLSQVNIQKHRLSSWLKQFNFDIPIEPFIISTNQSAVIRNIHNDHTFQHRFISLDRLLEKLNDIYNSFPKKILSKKDINRMIEKLNKNNEAHISNLIEQYQIKEHHLVIGIPCPDCDSSLQWWRGNSYCKLCQSHYRNQYVQTIYDYFLLHKRYITNEQCRHFLQLPTPDITYNVLNKLNLRISGKNKGRKYLSPKIHDFPQSAEPFHQKNSIFDR